MALQVLSCKTCNTDFAACIEEAVDSKWLKDCAKYIKGGNTKMQTKDYADFEKPLSSCCGKTSKQVEKQKERSLKVVDETQLKINL